MRKWATGLLLALWMAVIFIFSHQVAEESARSSQTVAYQIVSWQNQVFQLEKGAERSEERRVGNECDGVCRSGWWTDH